MKKEIIHQRNPRTPGILAGCGLFVLLCAACSSEELDENNNHADNEAVRITSISEITRATQEKLAPPDGTYYLGYKTTKAGDERIFESLQPVKVASGQITNKETGLYWASISREKENNKADFTLSNVNGVNTEEMEFPDNKDILWGKCSEWMKELKFTLSHQMAEVQVNLTSTFTEGVTIKEVKIKAIKQDFSFNRETGEVIPNEKEGTDLILTEINDTKEDATTTKFSAILPPQERTNEMELEITTSNNETYSRTLPYSMIEDIPGQSGQSQSVVLKFKAGHRLLLTANVTNNIDYTIFFTGATLKDWKYMNSHAIVAKPAGIYTFTELKDWTVKYNAYYKENISDTEKEKCRKALLRYGTPPASGGDKWTFTISRDITATTDGLTRITSFTDKLTNVNSYKITGINQSDLMQTVTGGTITDGIFEKDESK